ncbi:hypothetical protein [Natrinema sp. H-ect4]|uniref:hypothetical protein n=1 Tax=Natrinema sp. H-ect4 TaxID=3242699 RepID=UPI0035A92E11
MSGDRTADRTPRLEEYWGWVAVVLFLWLAVDLLTSVAAAATVGLESETNPLMAWLLGHHLAVVVAVHLGIAVLVVGLFSVLFARARAVPRRLERPVQLGLEGFLGVLVAIGLFAFANNVMVVVVGRGLF